MLKTIFEEKPNEHFDVKHIKMNADNPLHHNFAEPFDSFISGFCMNINGYSGSGKSNLLQNLFTMKDKNNKKCSFKNCFHKIFYVCPSQATVKNDIFGKLPEGFKFKKLNDFLTKYEGILEHGDKDGKDCLEKHMDITDHEKHRKELTESEMKSNKKKRKEKEKPKCEVLVIMDDIGTEIRLGENEKLFNRMVANRRHAGISIINITQRMMQIPPSIRGNLTHLISFKPKSLEEEDIIYDFTKLPKNMLREFYKMVFRDKHDFLLIDMSLTKANNFRLFRNFNLLMPLEITTDDPIPQKRKISYSSQPVTQVQSRHLQPSQSTQ
jgi:hypothetical protein